MIGRMTRMRRREGDDYKQDKKSKEACNEGGRKAGREMDRGENG